MVKVTAPDDARTRKPPEETGRPKIVLTRRRLADLEMLAIGGFAPLSGFLLRRDYEHVLQEMRLSDGTVWPIPVTLAVHRQEEAHIREGDEVDLLDERGDLVATMEVREKYPQDKKAEAEAVYGTSDPKHPGVAALWERGDVLLGGPVRILSLPKHHRFLPYRLTPEQVKQEKARRGWRTMIGFQTRNPIHRAHEYLTKCGLEICDGLLLHPLVGFTKADDVPAEVRMRCYEVLIEKYYPPGRVILAVNPANMHYAGPREAVLHAIVRRNFGCTHFIVGRDHAGVGNYYGPWDAQKIFERFRPEEIGITPVFFDNAFFCRACGGMATEKTCPHEGSERVILSGTKVREMLRQGRLPPPEFTRPEVAQILRQALKGT